MEAVTVGHRVQHAAVALTSIVPPLVAGAARQVLGMIVIVCVSVCLVADVGRRLRIDAHSWVIVIPQPRLNAATSDITFRRAS